MDLSAFTANYTHLSNDELLSLWADRTNLIPEASIALEAELQRRGLNKQNAGKVKKRLDALAAREAKGPLAKQVTAAKYERNMRHFVGWKEPEFTSPYGGRDIRTLFLSIRHRYRVWKIFRDHTGHWPVFSIWFHFLSWLLVLAFSLSVFVWVEEHKWQPLWSVLAISSCVLVLMAVRELGARLMRKIDWK